MKKLLSLLCAAALLFTLAGCSSKDQPDAVVTEFCDSMKAFDIEGMRDCLIIRGNDPITFKDKEVPSDIYKILKKNAASITYSLGETTEGSDDNKRIVPVSFTFPDISDAVSVALKEYISQALSMAFSGERENIDEDLFTRILVEKLDTIEPSTSELTVRFTCIRSDDDWKILDIGDSVINIIIGNMLDGLETLEDGLSAGDLFR